MARPVVAIVGRPNVGKSTLFNKLVGARLSIVDDKPGVTRDRIYGDCEWLGHRFLLVDTGGIEPRADDVILSQMRAQANIAIATADVIVLVTDLRSGRPLLIFPEGTRTVPGLPLDFQRGAAYIALRSYLPVLPVLIDCNPTTCQGKIEMSGSWAS